MTCEGIMQEYIAFIADNSIQCSCMWGNLISTWLMLIFYNRKLSSGLAIMIFLWRYLTPRVIPHIGIQLDFQYRKVESKTYTVVDIISLWWHLRFSSKKRHRASFPTEESLVQSSQSQFYGNGDKDSPLTIAQSIIFNRRQFSPALLIKVLW